MNVHRRAIDAAKQEVDMAWDVLTMLGEEHSTFFHVNVIIMSLVTAAILLMTVQFVTLYAAV